MPPSLMPAERLRVVVTRRLPDTVETRMRALFDTQVRADDTPMTRADLVQAMAGADVLVPCITDILDASVIAQAGPRMRLIASYGAGVDHIDVATARSRGILVSNTPGVLTEDAADMTLALILAVTRRMPQGMARMQSGTWDGWSPMAHLGTRLGGLRLGIVGMGRIGQAVARRAGAFGLSVHYHSRRRLRPETEADLAATWWQSLDAMLAHIDVLSLHCPSTPATFHLIDAARLALMKPGAVIVNTARGDVIDENALVRALRAGALAGAGLDVFEHGPRVAPDLQGLPGVVLLPHMAGATREGRVEMGEKVIVNIKTFADGHRPPDLVVPGQA